MYFNEVFWEQLLGTTVISQMKKNRFFELWPISRLTFYLLPPKINQFLPATLGTCWKSLMKIAVELPAAEGEQTDSASEDTTLWRYTNLFIIITIIIITRNSSVIEG